VRDASAVDFARVSSDSPATRRSVPSGTWLVVGLVGLAIAAAVLAKVFRRPPPPMPTTATTVQD
jgi:hypothetical protein